MQTFFEAYRDTYHDDVIKWKHFPRNWPFVRGIHRSPVNSPHKGQWRAALMFTLICVWINGWVNNCEAGDLRRYYAHYGVTVMLRRCFSHIGSEALIIHHLGRLILTKYPIYIDRIFLASGIDFLHSDITRFGTHREWLQTIPRNTSISPSACFSMAFPLNVRKQHLLIIRLGKTVQFTHALTRLLSEHVQISVVII